MLFCFQVLLFNLTCQLFRNYKKLTKTRNGICSSAELPPAYFITTGYSLFYGVSRQNTANGTLSHRILSKLLNFLT